MDGEGVATSARFKRKASPPFPSFLSDHRVKPKVGLVEALPPAMQTLKEVNDKLNQVMGLLDEEKRKREALEERLTQAQASFETQLNTVKIVVKAKMHELETQLEKERESKQQILTWVKTNLGPNLEHMREVIKEEIAFAKPHKAGAPVVIPTDPIALAAANLVKRKASTGATTSSSDATVTLSAEEHSGPASAPAVTTTTVQSPSGRSNSSGKTGAPSKAVSFNPSVTASNAKQPTSSPHGSQKDLTTIRLKDEETSPWDDEPLTEPQTRPRKITRNKKLMTLEEQCFGSDDVTESKVSPTDGSKKTKPTRAYHFLVTQNQANLTYKSPTLMDINQDYVAKGGRLVFVPMYPDDLKKDTFCFGIKTFDHIYPICPDGFNRSQVLYLVLKGVKRLLGNPDGVEMPHGARSGYDPFILRDSTNDQMQQFTHMPRLQDKDNILAKAFFEAFGQERVPRFGEEETKKSSADLAVLANKLYSEAQRTEIQKNKARMREYFDLYYYAQKPKEKTDRGRIIYFVFGSAVPIVLQRLMETNLRQDLGKFLVVALPFGVEPFTTAKPNDLVQTYKFYASLFKPITE